MTYTLIVRKKYKKYVIINNIQMGERRYHSGELQKVNGNDNIRWLSG